MQRTVLPARHAGLRSGGMGTVSDDTGCCAGIWSLLKRAMANFAAAPGLDHLTHIVKRKLKKIQCVPHRLISGCLAATGLTIEA